VRCPHCNRQIEDHEILAASGSIRGRLSKRTLTPEDAKAMQQRSVEARKRNQRKKARQRKKERQA
jgi:hypothetical protein